MILSFHPLFAGDRNILCAGRNPSAEDLDAIRAASAVILPQGASRLLYEMARAECPHVFPNYDARFAFPGKLGQIRLFEETRTPHPRTAAYAGLHEFRADRRSPRLLERLGCPVVFKYDWGGEGENVFLVQSPADLEKHLETAAGYEKTGQRGFLIQEYIPCGNRTLRVAVIGRQRIAYWRVQEAGEGFQASLASGGRVDSGSDPGLRKAAVDATDAFCRETGINLAGFDFLFAQKDPAAGLSYPPGLPLMLEINYFFGRRGLGGSEAYYQMLTAEIRRWLSETLAK